MKELDDFEALHKGTHVFLTVLAEYVDAFKSRTLSYSTRITKLASVVFFIRLWNLWLAKEGRSQSLHGLTSETVADVELSVASFCFVVAQFAELETDAVFDPERMVRLRSDRLLIGLIEIVVRAGI